MTPTAQLCTFRVDDLLFGLEVEHIQEVLRFQEMTEVPLAPAHVEGLINLRGQIVTAIDVRHQLGLPSRGEELLPMNVVLTPEHGSVSLLVDEIGDVIELGEDALESPPDTVPSEARDLIRGVLKLEASLLLLIDTRRVISFQPLV